MNNEDLKKSEEIELVEDFLKTFSEAHGCAYHIVEVSESPDFVIGEKGNGSKFGLELIRLGVEAPDRNIDRRIGDRPEATEDVSSFLLDLYRNIGNPKKLEKVFSYNPVEAIPLGIAKKESLRVRRHWRPAFVDSTVLVFAWLYEELPMNAIEYTTEVFPDLPSHGFKEVWVFGHLTEKDVTKGYRPVSLIQVAPTLGMIFNVFYGWGEP